MKYTVNYSTLLLNTLLDTIKRENRRTIDGTDIINFEKIIHNFVKPFNYSIEFDTLSNSELEKLKQFIHIEESANKETYTLLPWISEQELEESLTNTLFDDMSSIYQITEKELLLKRNRNEVFNLKEVEKKVNDNYLNSSTKTISLLEEQKIFEEAKLQKIQNTIANASKRK